MKNKYTICPNCGSDDMTMEKQGQITYHYKDGKFLYKIYDFSDPIFHCLDCDWRIGDLVSIG